jgi:putative inorganic carbon (hco3(-)) transporter
MIQALRTNWIPLVCTVFVLANLVFMANEFFWFNLVPAALLIVWAMFMAADRLLLLIAFATPLSINLEELEIGGIGVALPTEPLMVGLMFLFLLKVSLERNVIDERVWRHPITWIVLAQLVWMLVCIVPSSMPVVSIKYFIARLWFVCTMYLLVSRLFEDRRRVHQFIWAYLAGLSIVIVYTLIHHAQFGFAHDPAHWVMSPFFKDHTSYGAIIAFFLPFGILAVTSRSYSRTRRGIAFLLLGLLITGLIFSYTRAAWLSLVGAAGVFLVMRLRIPLWAIFSTLVVGGGLYLMNHEQIKMALERNREESSDDLGEHVRSISNISSDASNLERINRWNSAFRMWQERPVFGWGPGTYMFQYAPFQASEDRTIISTNFGVQGNAHSEYLGPLSEQGLPGFGLMIALILMTTVVTFRCYRRLPKGADRGLLMAAYLGLVTYYLHGALNNFLDTDKASVPFWAFTVLIVLIDLNAKRLPEGTDQNGNVIKVG